MLTLDITTSQQFIDLQAITNALLKGEKISVKQSGVEIGQFTPKTNTQNLSKERKLGFMQGEGVVPDDIHWGDEDIQAMFDESITNDSDFYQ